MAIIGTEFSGAQDATIAMKVELNPADPKMMAAYRAAVTKNMAIGWDEFLGAYPNTLLANEARFARQKFDPRN